MAKSAEEIKAWKRSWHARNRDKISESKRKAYFSNVEHYRARGRNSHYKHCYGITIEERDRILAEQGGACAICLSSDPRSTKGWHVDHDHKTGKVRGVLCNPCNVLLGNAREEIQVLEQAAKYLVDHGSS